MKFFKRVINWFLNNLQPNCGIIAEIKNANQKDSNLMFIDSIYFLEPNSLTNHLLYQ